MKKFQRYVFSILGWALLFLGLYQLISGIILVEQAYDDVGEIDIILYLAAHAAAVGDALQTIAIALLCMFAARICRLESDDEFKHDITQIVKRLRYAGVKQDN